MVVVVVVVIALYGPLALCMALYATGSATGIPGTPEKDIGVPGSMLIGPCVTGRKLGPAMSKGAVVLVLDKSS